MPEIPEVEAFKKYIDEHCLHKTIKDVMITDTRVIKTPIAVFEKNLKHTSFKKTERMGKFLVISLIGSHQKLVMHFALTGYLLYVTPVHKAATGKKSSDRFSVVIFVFDDGSMLHVKSVRKFAKLWLLDNITHIQELKNLGPDPLTLTEKQFLEIVMDNKHKNIKAFLMNQTIISGIGNEYSDEVLFQAGIDPHHDVGDLSSVQVKKLYHAMKTVLKYSIQLRLENLSHMGHQFFGKEDRQLFKSSYLQAHRHVDMVCPKNKSHKLKTAKIAGRTTYYCPIDQK